MAAGKSADAKPFIFGEPMIARDPSVVFIHFAEPFFPVVKLAGPQAGPGVKATGGNLRPVAPLLDEVHDFVTRIGLDPLGF